MSPIGSLCGCPGPDRIAGLSLNAIRSSSVSCDASTTMAPFKWTATADSIAAKLQRRCSQISGALALGAGSSRCLRRFPTSAFHPPGAALSCCSGQSYGGMGLQPVLPNGAVPVWHRSLGPVVHPERCSFTCHDLSPSGQIVFSNRTAFRWRESTCFFPARRFSVHAGQPVRQSPPTPREYHDVRHPIQGN
jgi:hypothetical protein